MSVRELGSVGSICLGSRKNVESGEFVGNHKQTGKYKVPSGSLYVDVLRRFVQVRSFTPVPFKNVLMCLVCTIRVDFYRR